MIFLLKRSLVIFTSILWDNISFWFSDALKSSILRFPLLLRIISQTLTYIISYCYLFSHSLWSYSYLSTITFSLSTSHPTPTPPPLTHNMHTRSKKGIVKPIACIKLHTSPISSVPRSHLQDLKDPNWHKAINKEYNSLITNDTWVLVPWPSVANVLRSRWLFKHKFHVDGSLSSYKPHLIANDCS